MLFFPANGVGDHTASQYLHQRYQTIRVLVSGLVLFETIAFPRATHPISLSWLRILDLPSPWSERPDIPREKFHARCYQGEPWYPTFPAVTSWRGPLNIWNSPFVPVFSSLFILHVLFGEVRTTSEPLETALQITSPKNMQSKDVPMAPLPFFDFDRLRIFFWNSKPHCCSVPHTQVQVSV